MSMIPFTFLIVIGIAAIAATNVLYSDSTNERHDGLRRAMVGCATTMITVGICGLVVFSTLWLSCPLIILAFFGLIVAWIQLRRAGREELLRVLVAAAERGIPLSSAARAFAADRNDGLGRRAELMAVLLDGGTSLADAANLSLPGLNTSTMVAIRLAEPLSEFGTAFSHSMSSGRKVEAQFRAFVNRWAYVYFLVIAVQLPLVFVDIKIIPVMQKMYREYGLQLPAITQAFQSFTDDCFKLSPVWITGIVGIGILGMLYYLGILPRNLLGLSWLMFPYDRAQVLRVLAWGVQRQKPMPELLELIAQRYPRRYVQRRVKKAGTLVSQGRDWRESLRAVSLLKAADVAVLFAAERAKNLPWGLEALADNHVRRLLFRWRAISTVLFPIATLVIGAFVLTFCVAAFIPLVDLITKLS